MSSTDYNIWCEINISIKNMKKLRIIISSNAPYSKSGYGQQMAEFLPLIRDEGYPLATINFFGLQGGTIETAELPGVKQYPIINHIYGSDALIHHAKDFQADVVFTLQDIWVLNPEDLAKVNHFIPIMPVDHDPVSPSVIDKLRYAYRVVTYAKFGQQQLLNHGVFSTYIPHTVDTDIFKPIDKKKRKEESKLPSDCFLVGMVGANKDNPPRKSFQEAMDAFKDFLKVEPKALLYIHSQPQFPGGFPFQDYARFLGISDKLFFPDSYQMNFNIGKKEMANIYNTFDVLLEPSASEGFGVPIIEAEACGIPVITTNFTSMPELITEETGVLVDVGSKRWTRGQSYWGIPSTKSIYDCLVKIHTKNRIEMGKAARKWIVENFDTKMVFAKYWRPFLEELEFEIYGKPEVLAKPKE